MKSKKIKHLRLWLILPFSFIATGIIAQTTTHSAANSGSTAWLFVGAVAVILMIMNLKKSIKKTYINLFTKKI